MSDFGFSTYRGEPSIGHIHEDNFKICFIGAQVTPRDSTIRRSDKQRCATNSLPCSSPWGSTYYQACSAQICDRGCISETDCSFRPLPIWG